MEKVKTIISKMFNTKNKNNTIISIVALVQCIILIVMASYSWIEKASSLIIQGDHLLVTDGRNYEFQYDVKEKQMVDLSSYFINSDHFSFAQASSADAQSFFFPYKVGSTTKYRKGDTTDYNVTYYNIDLNAKSEVDMNFFFENDDIFKFTSDNFTDKDGNEVDISTDDKNAFYNAFRIAVSVENGAPVIFSKTGNTATAKTETGTKSTTSKKLSDYCYAENKDDNIVFISDNDGTYVDFKIWLEEQDPDYKKLAAAKKEALLGADIRVEFNLICTEVQLKQLTFNDYSTFTKTKIDTRDRVYYVNNGTYYPMTSTKSNSTSTTWVTCDGTDKPTSTIPNESVDFKLKDGYFMFGHKEGTTYVEYCQWDIDDNANISADNTFNAISATKTDENQTVGYGYWNNVPLTRVKFVDKTTYANATDYNAGATKFIKKDQLYVVGDIPVITMNYFSDDGCYAAYVPSTWLNNNDDSDNYIPFVYTSTPYYNKRNIAVQWLAEEQTGSVKYTAIGYSNEGYLSNQIAATGVGTWGEVEKINLSAELVDTTVLASPDSLFRVKFNNTNVYLASDTRNPLAYYAYVPENSEITFEYGKLNETKTDFYAGYIKNDCATYYLTDVANSKGMWNLAVVVDGTTDNLINDTLTNASTTGAYLKYTVDGAQPADMTKVDSYRWITGDLTEKTLTEFTWKAYSKDKTNDQGKNYEETVFNYKVDSVIDGIYYLTITENGTIVKTTSD